MKRLRQMDPVFRHDRLATLEPRYALIGHARPGDTFAIHRDRPVTAAEFLAQVAALAKILPNCPYTINLCTDRYRFTVGFAAALCRRQVTLLPPNETAGMLQTLTAEFRNIYCLTDHALSAPDLRTVVYNDALESDAEPGPIPTLPGGRAALLLFTSGSTGSPKPVARSWGALVRSSGAAAERLGIGGFPLATVIGTVPHQHSYGLESTMLLPMLHGLVVHSERPFYPQDVIARLEAVARPRILVTTPIHIRALLSDQTSLPPVDLVISATAPLSNELAQQAEARFSAPLLEIYGCTEAGQIATRNTTETAIWHCFRGITLRQDEQGTWAGGLLIEAETLLHDMIELQSSTDFVLGDRMADIVNVAGKRGSLSELNRHLTRIDGVRDGVFFAPEATDDRVTRLAAFVVAPGLSADSVLKHLRKRIDPAFLPRPLVFVEALPRNAAGKLPLDRLLALLRRKDVP